jgi:23S rRNA pseudouridine1911/1915/1917 synthase
MHVLYEDNHIIIVSKASSEIVQGYKTGDMPLSEMVKAYIKEKYNKPGAVFLGVVHRLDRPVSGVVVFARTSKALERLNAMFRDSDVHKFYWALVCNAPEPQEGRLEDMMWRNEKQNKSYICRPGAARKDAKLAKLNYRQIGRTDRYWLVEVELLTGRHHQIRCQLSNLGCPIKGDLKYGAPRSNPDGGISLHARRITFVHPVKKEPMTVEAPVPSSWKGV